MKYVLTMFIALMSPVTIACSCPELDVAAQLPRYPKVYVGKVIWMQELGTGYTSRWAATLEVSEIFKGDVYDLEEAVTSHSDASCGVTFRPEASYLVFEDEDGEVMSCTTKALEGVFGPRHTDDLALLRKIAPEHKVIQ